MTCVGIAGIARKFVIHPCGTHTRPNVYSHHQTTLMYKGRMHIAGIARKFVIPRELVTLVLKVLIFKGKESLLLVILAILEF